MTLQSHHNMMNREMKIKALITVIKDLKEHHMKQNFKTLQHIQNPTLDIISIYQQELALSPLVLENVKQSFVAGDTNHSVSYLEGALQKLLPLLRSTVQQ